MGRGWILLLPSALVFLSWMLQLSLSSVTSPVTLSTTRTHSRWYGRCEPLNTVCAVPEPSMCGTVTVIWFFSPTSTLADLDVSTEAGLKSYLMEWNAEPELLEKLRPSFSSLTSLPIRSLSAVPLCIFR